MTLKNKPSPQKKKDKLPRSVGTLCYWRRVEKYPIKNEEVEPKQKQCPAVDVADDGSKV